MTGTLYLFYVIYIGLSLENRFWSGFWSFFVFISTKLQNFIIISGVVRIRKQTHELNGKFVKIELTQLIFISNKTTATSITLIKSRSNVVHDTRFPITSLLSIVAFVYSPSCTKNMHDNPILHV